MASKPYQFITLTTDFGHFDGFVACVKGVILSYAPQVSIFDISHEVKPFDVQSTAWIINNTYSYFPKGTIHVVVVDPGVGTCRRPLLLVSDDHIFIGPDNGVFSYILENKEKWQAYILNKPEYYLQEPSATFHGRDIFAPVAGHIASGVKPKLLGAEIDLDTLVKFNVSEPLITEQSVIGEIIYIDRFGNLITNIPQDAVKPNTPVYINGKAAGTIGTTYGSVKVGQITALIGSHGYVEIGVNGGRGDLALGVGLGAQVLVQDMDQNP